VLRGVEGAVVAGAVIGEFGREGAGPGVDGGEERVPAAVRSWLVAALRLEMTANSSADMSGLALSAGRISSYSSPSMLTHSWEWTSAVAWPCQSAWTSMAAELQPS
jgi:hypothetical protein